MTKAEEKSFYHQQSITDEWLAEVRKQYQSNPGNKVLEESLSQKSISEVSFLESKAKEHPFRFSVELETMDAVSQGYAGRCWIVSGLNLLREYAAKQIPDLEGGLRLSAGYVSFFDKLEKANCFLEKMLVLREEPYDDRRLASWLRYAITDGGFWVNFKDLVEKYGIVPAETMPETHQSECTEEMNNRLNLYLRKIAAKIRQGASEGYREAELRKIKEEAMDKIYTFLCRCYGSPATEFVFQGLEYTPLSFYQTFIGDYADQFVNVISLDCAKLPYGKGCVLADTYGLIGGEEEVNLNLPLAEMKEKCVRQLRSGIPIVCVADDDKMCAEELQLWDDQSFDIFGVTGFDVEMDRTDIFQMKAGFPGHAWMITGVNVQENGTINQWKIENSYDLDSMHHGYCSCSDSWFDKFVYSVLLHKSVLTEYEDVLADETTTLSHVFHSWDIM